LFIEYREFADTRNCARSVFQSVPYSALHRKVKIDGPLARMGSAHVTTHNMDVREGTGDRSAGADWREYYHESVVVGCGNIRHDGEMTENDPSTEQVIWY